MQLTNFPRYTYRKGGTYYFSRRVPSDLRRHYSRSRIVVCLRTSLIKAAEQSAKTLSVRLEDYWARLRMQAMELPAAHLMVPEAHLDGANGPTLTDALNIYLSLKGDSPDKVFSRTATRNIQNVIDVLGDRPVSAY